MSAFFDPHREGAHSRGAIYILVLIAALLLLIPTAAAQGTDRLRGGAYAIDTFYMSKPAILEHLPTMLRDGEYDRALKQVKALISTVETDPTAPYAYHAYTALCVTETAREDYTSALKACDRAIRYRPDHWEAMNNRGAMYFASGNFDGARADFEAAARTAPNSEAAELVARNLTAATASQQ